jgi:mono/diheme cytochrome c family protein
MRRKNKSKRSRFRFSGPVILVTLVLLSFFWVQSGKARVKEQTLAEGQNAYQNFCAGCHEATGLQLVTKPPKLDGLFRRKKLPSGAPVTDQTVRNVILNGRGIMPPFRGTLSSKDVGALIQYLHTK